MFTSGIYRMFEGRTVCFGQSFCEAVLIFPIYVWPRELIKAGDDGIIKVTFNTGKREGKQNKTVTLVTNAIPSTKVLTIKGTVLVPKNN